MSIALMTAAWALEIGATDKIVLLALADHANDDGYCWPGNASLAKKCGLSERAIRMALRSLEQAGHVTCHFVTGKSTSYHCHPGTSCPRQDMPPAPRAATPAPRAPKSSVIIKSSTSPAAQRWHRLPVDWQPKPLPPALAAKRTDWPDGWEAEALEDFRAWAANAADSNGKGRKLEWDQAWQNWLRRNDRERKPSTGNRPLGSNGRSQPMGRSDGARGGQRRNPAMDMLRDAIGGLDGFAGSPEADTGAPGGYRGTRLALSSGELG